MSRLPLELGRVFTAAKTIDVPTLNTLGVQVARSVVARALYRARPHSAPAEVQDWVREIRSQGLLVVPNFLSPPDFDALRDESLKLWAEHPARARLHEHGANTVEYLDVLALGTELAPRSNELFAHPKLRAVLESAEKRTLDMSSGHRSLERLTQRESDLPDTQADLHLDSFFHTHKAWLYLDRITEDHGPLVYVPRSHRLDRVRMKWDYRESRGPNRPSRRISAHELRERNLEERVLTCEANTLVVANTSGYHRRLRGRPGTVRHSAQLNLRFNPFFPAQLQADRWLTRRNPWLKILFPETSPAPSTGSKT